MSDPSQFLPHKAPMLLLTKVLETSENKLESEVHITKDSPFFSNTGVPSEVGLEYMAQTAALFAGAQSVEAGDQPKIAFLLGARKLEVFADQFNEGDLLTVTATPCMHEGALMSFDTEITHDGKCLMKTRLTAMQPTQEMLDSFKGNL